MPLCDRCESIPAELFDLNTGLEFQHWPLSIIKWSSDQGCQLCEAIAGLFEVSIYAYEPVKISGPSDPTDSSLEVKLYGIKIGNIYFSRIPKPWCSVLPIANLGIEDDYLQTMKAWLRYCVDNHPGCGKEESFLPTRVLDLKYFDNSNDLALVNSDSSPQSGVTYMTLSHCWGSPSRRPMITTTLNLADRLERICFTDLPPTFQNAVTITRGLDIRYLWIDSLCIIQDSQEDWERESAVMGAVYSKSICTLAAASSRDSYGGCKINPAPNSDFDPTQRFDVLKIPKSTKEESWRIRIFKTPPLSWEMQINSGPLRVRAWVLQERLLSRRTIHFSQNVLLWECKSEKATSEMPWMQMKDLGDKSFAALGLLDNKMEKICSVAKERQETWYKIVEAYTTRALTNERDKLPAMSALADEQSLDRGKYAAGLWEYDMPSALLWTVKEYESPQRPSKYRAPTWSWASLDSQITYDTQRVQLTSREENPENLDGDFGSFRILEVSVVPAGLNLLGEVSSAYIRLQGCLKPAFVDLKGTDAHLFATHTHRLLSRSMRRLLSSDGQVVGAIYADVLSEVQDGQEIHCLQIRREPERSVVGIPHSLYIEMYPEEPEDLTKMCETVMGLALVRVTRDSSTFRRVGIVRWMKELCFSDVPIETITLI